MVASLVHTIFVQERAEDTWRQLGEVVTQLTDAKLADAAQLADTAPDVLTYTVSPEEMWHLEQQLPGTAQPRTAAPTSWASSPPGLP